MFDQVRFPNNFLSSTVVDVLCLSILAIFTEEELGLLVLLLLVMYIDIALIKLEGSVQCKAV